MSDRLLRVLALVLLAFAAPAGALDRDRSIAQFHHTAWTARDGAPSQISALAQTADGYLWIGSARGLYHFDGVRFETLQPPPGQSLPSFNVYALATTHDGGLWVAFRPSGLGYLARGHLQVFEGAQIPHSIVYTLTEDRQGRIWAGTADGLALREGMKWVDVGASWGMARARVWSMLVSREGALWVATTAGIYVLPPRAKQFLRVNDALGSVHRMVEAPDGRIWVADEGRAAIDRYDAHSYAVAPIVDPAIDGTQINDFMFDRDGSLWIALTRDGIRRIRYPERLGGVSTLVMDIYKQADGLTSNAIGLLLEDREGNLWVSTLRGLNRFRHSQLVPVSLPPSQQNFTLVADGDGTLWVGGTTSRGVDRIDNAVAAGLTPASLVPGSPAGLGSVFTGDRARTGDVWWGDYGGVWRQRGSHFVRFPSPAGMKKDWAWEVMSSGGDGQLWVGYGDDGLWRIDGDGSWQRPATPAGMLERAPSASFTTAKGDRWFGYTANRVAVLSGGTLHSYGVHDGLEIGRIRVIRGGGDPLWLGGETGLSMFSHGRFHTVAVSGVPALGTVCGIIPSRSGDLWLNELHGVVHIDAAEISALQADPTHVAKAELFDYLDGLPGAPQMNWCSSSAVEASDGRLWFATDNGLAWLDPHRLWRNELPPPVYIRGLVADGKPYAADATIALPPGTANLRLDYTALSLTMPERVNFRYRLDGLDSNWREAGTRRDASYTHLGPGRYTFRVIASNNDGVWNTRGAQMAFEIRPAFYQTGWFLLLCIAVGVGAVLMMLWLRTEQIRSMLRAQMEARHGERERIARELHDTLLQGVQGLILRVHAATRSLGDDHPARRSMDRALDQAEEILVEGRDRLGELRAGAPKHFDLATALAKLADEQLPHIEFGMTVEGLVRPLAPEAGDEIYQIGREAILNAMRHAQASAIHCRLSYSSHEFVMRIQDNGKGIDPAILDGGRRSGHWGLVGMRERATMLHGQLSIGAGDTGGVLITLSVPAGIAYARRLDRAL